MKRKSSLLSAFLLVFLMCFTSCQEEIEDIRQGGENEVITSNSTLANLMQRSSASDGDVDDFLDDYSCGRIVTPFTVEVGGISITIESDSDYETAIDIISELDDNFQVNFQFPLKIILNNYTQIEVDNQEQMNILIEECGDIDLDDEIECLDFVYPITFFTYNSDSEQIGEVNIGSDADMYLFLSGLEDSIRVSMEFPVKVELSDGSILEINSNSELEEAIEKAELVCSDDDGSVDTAPFVEVLTDGAWFITDFAQEEIKNTCAFSTYGIHFHTDGQVVAENETERIEGTWTVKADDGKIEVEVDFENELFDSVELDWEVYRFDSTYIKLREESGTYIYLKREPFNCFLDEAELNNLLITCPLKVVEGSLPEDDEDYAGYLFDFAEEGTVNVSKAAEGVIDYGSWFTTQGENGAELTVKFTSHASFNAQWIVHKVAENKIKLFNDSEMILLEKACEDRLFSTELLQNILKECSWTPTSVYIGGAENVEQYTDYKLDFDGESAVTVITSGDDISGSYEMEVNTESNLILGLNLGNLTDFNNSWIVGELSAERIVLISGDHKIILERGC